MGAHSRTKYEDLGPEKQPGKLPLYEQLKLPLGFPDGSVVKSLRAMQETQVQSLGREDPLEEGMATQSRRQRTLEGHGPQGRKELDMTEAT